MFEIQNKIIHLMCSKSQLKYNQNDFLSIKKSLNFSKINTLCTAECENCVHQT